MLNNINYDIISEILTYLDNGEKLILRLVNNRLNDIVKETGHIHITIKTLKHAKKLAKIFKKLDYNITKKYCKKTLLSLQHHITSVSLNNKFNLPNGDLISLEHLTILKDDRYPITPIDDDTLIKLTNLQKLSLYRLAQNSLYSHGQRTAKITDNSIKCLTNLVSLCLDFGNAYDKITEESLSHLQNLDTLMLMGNTTIRSISYLKNLKTLYLRNNSHIKQISTLTNLTSLSLDDNKLIDADQLTYLHKLHTLDIKNISNINDQMRNLTNLTDLTITNSVLTKSALEILSLKHLALHNCDIQSLPTLPNLISLTLTKCKDLKDKDIIKQKNLTALDVLDVGITVNGIIQLHKLKSLMMTESHHNNITLFDEPDPHELRIESLGLISVSRYGSSKSLADLTNINHIHLTNLDLTNNQYIKTVDLIKFTNLTSLKIGGTRVGPFILPKLTNLKTICLKPSSRIKVQDINEYNQFYDKHVRVVD